MRIKTIVPGVLLAALVGVAAWALPQGSAPAVPPPASTGAVLYYGAECPHCKVVEKYLEDHKIAVPQKEVWHDQANAREMIQRAQACGIKEDSVGVPFLSVDGKCVVGDQPIIQYFQSGKNAQK